MTTRNRKTLVFWIGLAVAVASVGVVRAAATPGRAAKAEVERIVPIATPADLAPCAMATCW